MNCEMKCLKAAQDITHKLHAFVPVPDIADRTYWTSLPEGLVSSIISLGDQALAEPIPAVYATDFMLFKREGNRAYYEQKYFRKRHLLGDCVMAECVTDSGKYLDRIIDLIYSICEESTWILPAHNSYVRDTPQIILPDVTRPVIELFSCDTGAGLATVRHLLKPRLDQVSELICKRIELEVTGRMLTPYLTEHFWWMGKDDEPMCNWTSWCTQNVLIAAFISDSPIGMSNGSAILHKAAASCDYFLKDYGEDGCCDEGAQYFRHAGLTLYGALQVMNAVSDGGFAHLYEDTQIRNIAAYISNMHVDGPYYFNFADCSPLAGRCGVREFLYGQDTGQSFLMDFAALDYQYDYEQGNLFNSESQRLNLYYRLLTVHHCKEILDYAKQVSACATPPDVFYESVGILTARGSVFSLAVKVGDNDDSHNHNDTGSVILYKNGSPILVDIGVETYTQKTFSPERYTIWTMQSGYHNLPTINGLDQGAGSTYRATDVQCIDTPKTRGISMNIATAYPNLHAPYIRCVTYDKVDEVITIEDTTENDSVILNFITYHQPMAIGSDTIEIGDAVMNLHDAQFMEVQTLPITDDRLKTAWDHDLYRIRLIGSHKSCISIR